VRPKSRTQLPFGRTNYLIFAVGILILFLGYIALAQGPADSFWSLTLAPILLVIGYLVVIPLAILYREPKSRQPQAGH
jgi:hypothetical protein